MEVNNAKSNERAAALVPAQVVYRGDIVKIEPLSRVSLPQDGHPLSSGSDRNSEENTTIKDLHCEKASIRFKEKTEKQFDTSSSLSFADACDLSLSMTKGGDFKERQLVVRPESGASVRVALFFKALFAKLPEQTRRS